MKAAAVFEKLKTHFANFSLLSVLPVFLLGLVLEMAHFFPGLHEINLWDEASYIHGGYLILQGNFPAFAANPLISILYALASLPVIQSPWWFLISDAIVRIALFSLVFFSAYCIARQLRAYTNPWVLTGMMLIIPVATTMFLFPSDILFTAISGFAFAQALSYYQTRRPKNLIWASALLGLGGLARADALIILVLLCVMVVILAWSAKRWWQHVLAVCVPFVLVIGGYILVSGLATGNFDPGLSGRTYDNFEAGHETIILDSSEMNASVYAHIKAREAFGTPEENNYSVFNAIQRNPQVYWQRFKAQFESVPKWIVKAYGNKFVVLLLWLSLRGILALLQQKQAKLLALMLFWLSPIAVSFVNTFHREGYFLMGYFIIFSLASIGLTAIIRNFDRKGECLLAIVCGIAALMIGVFSRNTSIIFRVFLFDVGLLLAYLFRRYAADGQVVGHWQERALWLMLAIVLLIRGGYPSPKLPLYGISEREQVLLSLSQSFEEGDLILAGAPGVIWAAKLNYAGLNGMDIPNFADVNHFVTWLRVQNIRGIYLDADFPPKYLPLLNASLGNGVELMYEMPGEQIIIYQVD